MIPSPLVLALALTLSGGGGASWGSSSGGAGAQQVRDATAIARDAYTACLRRFMQRSLTERMAPAAFQTALPQQCGAEETAFRAVVVARETASGTAREQAEQYATEEVEDARSNFAQLFELNATPPS